MLKLYGEANNSKFVARKWNIINHQSHANYGVGNETIYNTEVLKSNLWDFNDVYILVRGNIITAAHNHAIFVALEHCALFTKCILKIVGTTVDDAEDEAINSDANIANIVSLIVKHATIAVPLKYLSNFWRSLEMSLINCKVELKLRWRKHYVLALAGVESNDVNFENIIFTTKNTK